MTEFPDQGHMTDNARTKTEVKTDLELMLAATKQLIGGTLQTELTISGGAVTPTTDHHTIDTEADATNDTLDTIGVANHPDGRFVYLRAEDATRKVTVTHLFGGTGQISLLGGRDIMLNKRSTLILQRVGNDWVQVFETRIGGGCIGSISTHAGANAPPCGILCYGQLVNVIDEPELFAEIGQVFGGDGVNNFGIPDLRDRVEVGKGDMGGAPADRITDTGDGNPGFDTTVLGGSAGVDRFTLLLVQMPGHDHTYSTSLTSGSFSGGSSNPGNHSHSYSQRNTLPQGGVIGQGAPLSFAQPGTTGLTTGGNGSHSHSVSGSAFGNVGGTTSTVGGDEAHPNVQPSMALNKVIWT